MNGYYYIMINEINEINEMNEMGINNHEHFMNEHDTFS